MQLLPVRKFGFRIRQRYRRCRYGARLGLAGFLFGFVFIGLGLGVDLMFGGQWPGSFFALLRINPAHGVIALAPLVLGTVFFLLGCKYDQVIRQLKILDRARMRSQYLAEHDPLTRLPNRIFFNRFMSKCLAEMGDTSKLVVIVLNLDRFKEINDVYGHRQGDLLLSRIAQRVCAVAGTQGQVMRLGGDEFVIVSREISTRADAYLLAKEIAAAVKAPQQLDGHSVQIDASIGIAVYPDNGMTETGLLSSATVAISRVRADRTLSSIRFFEPEMDEAVRARHALSQALKEAQTGNQLILYYQAQADTRTGQVTGAEALLRWQHPQHGLVSPAEFIPIAEETGLIIPIGEWVLRTACMEAMTWHPSLTVAVNVSPMQLRQRDLAERFEAVLAETGLPPHRLELEVTESILIHDPQRALHTLQQLKRLGVMIAIDDFGTGYSALSSLRLFPFDKIKIDRSFLYAHVHGGDERDYLEVVLGMGHYLNVPMLAEGVETPGQLAYLQSRGCAEVQGFFINRPAPAALQRHILLATGTGERYRIFDSAGTICVE